MKIILSRKGFDSQYGGIPSPIFADLGPTSLPIPLSEGIELSRCKLQGRSLEKVVADLSGKEISPNWLVHLDPDLCSSSVKRKPGWRPSFGQADAAQGHLSNQNVGVGDLFLFFGWFQHVQAMGGRWAYSGSRQGFHALFGWLQVDRIIDVDAEIDSIPPWLEDHVHVMFHREMRGKRNTIYVGRERLGLGSVEGLSGAGRFNCWHDSLQLTKNGESRSKWSLPGWFNPWGKKTCLSYHGNPKRWTMDGDRVILTTVGKGQEFVLDTNEYPQAIGWAEDLICKGNT